MGVEGEEEGAREEIGTGKKNNNRESQPASQPERQPADGPKDETRQGKARNSKEQA